MAKPFFLIPDFSVSDKNKSFPFPIYSNFNQHCRVDNFFFFLCCKMEKLSYYIFFVVSTWKLSFLLVTLNYFFSHINIKQVWHFCVVEIFSFKCLKAFPAREAWTFDICEIRRFFDSFLIRVANGNVGETGELEREFFVPIFYGKWHGWWWACWQAVLNYLWRFLLGVAGEKLIFTSQIDQPKTQFINQKNSFQNSKLFMQKLG